MPVRKFFAFDSQQSSIIHFVLLLVQSGFILC